MLWLVILVVLLSFTCVGDIFLDAWIFYRMFLKPLGEDVARRRVTFVSWLIIVVSLAAIFAKSWGLLVEELGRRPAVTIGLMGMILGFLALTISGALLWGDVMNADRSDSIL